MREILFKAKRIDNGEWVEGSFIDQSKLYKAERYMIRTIKTYNNDQFYIDEEVYPKTLCQYTGLTDENGVNIFENDILRFTSKREKTYYESTIEWEDGHFMVSERQDNDSFLCIVNGETTEVIGNIHD